MTIWIDGSFREKDQACISVFDHGLLYGDGLFEGLRTYHGRVFRLRAHLERLFDGARALMIDPPGSLEALQDLVEAAVRRDGSQENYIRLLLTRGEGPLGIDPTTCPKPSLIIIVDAIRLYPQEYYRSGVPLICSSYRRTPLDSFDVRIKSLNYINNVMARLEAKRQGAQEAILLNHQGHVAECTGDNIIVVRDGGLYYPDFSCGALEGITIKAILELARAAGMPVQAARLGMYDLYSADEVLLTGTGAELVPVSTIDGRHIGTGERPVFNQLRAAFANALQDPSWVQGGGRR